MTFPHVHSFREAIVPHGAGFVVVQSCVDCHATLLRSVTAQDAMRLPFVGISDVPAEPAPEPAQIAA